MIKYDEPRTWWRVWQFGGSPEPVTFIGETGAYLFRGDAWKTRDKKITPLRRWYDNEADANAAADANRTRKRSRDYRYDWEAAALAACEGMTTEQLTPGCVMKLVEALESTDKLLANIQQYGAMAHESDWRKCKVVWDEIRAALAAMKGV